MAVRIKLSTLLFAGLLLGACAEEGGPQTPRDVDDDTSSAMGSKDDDDGADDDDSDDDGSDEDAGADDDDAGSDDDDDSTAEDEDAGAAEDEDDAGATEDEDDAGAAEDEDEVAASCDELTYEDFGEDFIDTYCIACHTGDEPVGGFPLDTLDDIAEHKAEIIEQVVVAKEMPPKGSKAPTAGEREMLEAWLDCGPE